VRPTAAFALASTGAPSSLARLVRARVGFFGGACLVDATRADVATTGTPEVAAYDVPLDFYAAYHVPFFSTWAICEKAAALAASGDREGAAAVLDKVAGKAPNRTWIEQALAKYR